ncbi:SRPBCC family protein [Hamadaea tsunoensis]|uniref:SRPBCC family protein n=1 Tax=Hamadaea tsunoensis TaxID=53368 RepID=UPI0004866AE0|nr:SRPBCC family protein [Hamadaea tsunoensis]
MIHISRTFAVDKPPETVVAYLADFANATEWDPGTVRCTKVSAGPVQVGSTWTNVSKVLGRQTELTYRLTRLEADRVTLVGTNKTATSTDDITVRPSSNGSEITYDATIEFHGIANLATPFLKIEFERLGTATEESMRAAIGRLADGGQRGAEQIR